MLDSSFEVYRRGNYGQTARWWLYPQIRSTILSFSKEDIGTVVKQSLELGILVNLLILFGKAAFFLLLLVANIRAHMEQSHVAYEDEEKNRNCGH